MGVPMERGKTWPRPRDAPVRCSRKRRPEAAWAFRYRKAWQDPSRAMHQLSALVGDDQWKHERADLGRLGKAPPGRCAN